MRRTVAAIAVVVAITLANATSTAAVIAGESHKKSAETITLVTHDSFAVSKGVLKSFEHDANVKVKIVRAGDAGAALNQAILTKGNPLGDVFFGVDNTFLSRATDAGIFASYRSSQLSHVPKEFQLDGKHRLTPVDHGDVCINYDKQYFTQHNLAVPRSLDDLAKTEYRGLLVAENPATSSPGLAFVLATIAKFGDSGWRDYWKRLRDNDVKIDDGWEQAYNGDFSAGEGHGGRPLVVSYASSPPAAVYFAKPQPKESPVGTVLSSCFRQIEFVGVLKGTAHAQAVHKLVDFMLSTKFQQDVPLQMFVFPVRDGVSLPDVFKKFADVPSQPLSLAPGKIGEQRDRWIDEWTDTVLR